MADEERNIPKEQALLGRTADEMVLLGQAGWSKEAVDRQVEHICNSSTFDDQDSPRKLLRYLVLQAILGRVPHPADILVNITAKKKVSASYVRTTAFRLRRKLKEYYEQAKPTEIRLEVPPEEYFVLAPRNTEVLVNLDDTPSASILEPLDKAEVYCQVMVRGRIDVLNPDLRPWLVVYAPDDCYYPQSRVSRRSPSWAYEVRIGRGDWGQTEGVEFSILLVAADIDGDGEFHAYKKARLDGFGARMPTDIRVLDSIRVVRRDIRREMETRPQP